MLEFVLNLIKRNAQFLKYCVGGGMAFAVDFSLLYLFTFKLGIWYIWSATLAFAMAVAVNYLIQRFWTFKPKAGQAGSQFFLFLIAQIIGLGINNTTLYILVDGLGAWVMLAKAAAAGIVLIWNFWASKKFVFKSGQPSGQYQALIAGEIFPPDIGGPATYSYRLVKYLLEHHYNLRVICYSYALPDASDEEFAGKIDRVNAAYPLPLKYFIYFIKLLMMARSTPVIYAQGPVASGFPAFLASKIWRKKLVVKVVGDYAWEQARLFHATAKTIDDWENLREFKAKSRWINAKLKLIGRIEQIVIKHADQIIVPSHYLKNLVERLGAGPGRVNVIYNSVDYRKARHLSRAEAQDIIKVKGDLILTVGRLMNWKGTDTLIAIMPDLLRENPDFKLVIIGDGPEEKNLKKLIIDLKLEQSVIMVGRIHQSKIGYYYSAASLFALNSCYEGLSHVILDAINYRLPVIASRAGGNPELIQDGFNGIMADYNDKPAWINAILDIWRDRDKQVRFSSNTMVKMEVFSFAAMAKKTIGALGIAEQK